jgi:predicted DNA-binding protein with PD1-like motif
VKASELTTGRTFGVTFEHGENFFSALTNFCVKHEVRQGYIPMFIGAFSQAEIVGACGPLTNPEAPVWERTSVQSVEALGGGTLAFDDEAGSIAPHIHLPVGPKAASAEGRTSHLLSATVQFLSELLIVEVVSPTMTRPRNHELFDVPLLTFG